MNKNQPDRFLVRGGGAQPEECGCGHFALYRFIFYDDQHFAAVFRHIGGIVLLDPYRLYKSGNLFCWNKKQITVIKVK